MTLSVLKTMFQVFCLMVGCFRWRVNLVAVTPTWPEAKVFDVLFFLNLFVFSRILWGYLPRRRIWWEEKRPTYMWRRHREARSPRAHLPPLLSKWREGGACGGLFPDWAWSDAKEQSWSWKRAEHTGIDRAWSEERSQAVSNHSQLHLQIWKTSGLILLF